MRTPDEAYAYSPPSARFCSTPASATSIWRKARSAATPTSASAAARTEFGTKVEVKNLNSFRYLAKALDTKSSATSHHRIRRPHLARNAPVESGANRTDTMRSKEKAHDYRYFPEPDSCPSTSARPGATKFSARSPNSRRQARPLRFRLRHHAIRRRSPHRLARARRLFRIGRERLGAPAKPPPTGCKTELLRRLNDSGKEITVSPVKPAALGNSLHSLKPAKHCRRRQESFRHHV